jgi:peptidoglycan/LPS O-acetylase OafA/YrhL
VKTIADYDQGRDNNYHLIRFIAAALVIVAHSYYLSASGGKEPLRALTGYKHFGEVGVQIFFLISGFLVTKSFLSRRDVFGYLEARALRIFPALIVAVALTVLVIGPLATTVPLGEYFSDENTIQYFLNNTTLKMMESFLPGVFLHNPYPRVVNGSLWSLFPEVRLYLWVALFGVLGILSARRAFNHALILCLLLYVYFPGVFHVWGYSLHAQVAGYFALGAFCYVNRDVVPIHGSIAVVLTAAALVLHGTAYFPRLFDLAVSYGVLFCAYSPSGWIRRFNAYGDYSYGAYIYAFPVQQLIASVLPHITALPMLAGSFVLTMPLAMCSWHFIEKPSLAAKGKLWGGLARNGKRWREALIARGGSDGRPSGRGKRTADVLPLHPSRSERHEKRRHDRAA